MDEMDERVAVAIIAAVDAVMQAAAEPEGVGLDTSNPERVGQATSNRGTKMWTPTNTSDRIHHT